MSDPVWIPVWLAIIATFVPTLTILFAFYKLRKGFTGGHVQLNSRLDELERLARKRRRRKAQKP